MHTSLRVAGGIVTAILAGSVALPARATIPGGPGPVVLPGECVPQVPAPIAAAAPVLAQWSLIVPVSKSGQPAGKDAAFYSPARVDAPYLTQRTGGSLSFYAPSVGATTPGSPHPRTELERLHTFGIVAGDWNTMTATVAVTQVPSDTHKIIIGQLHYNVDRPFVTLRYDNGTVNVIADRGASCTLLTGVALGQRFSYQITQRGYYLLFAASTTVGRRTVRRAVITGLPDAMRGTTGRFSAGDYQQDVLIAGSAGRVTFYGLQTEGGGS
jgi:hypothetical protein